MKPLTRVSVKAKYCCSQRERRFSTARLNCAHCEWHPKELSAAFLVAASVRLHGARPWHPQKTFRGLFGSCEREAPRHKAVASAEPFRGLFGSCEREAPRR